jgi:tetratricopeptide (TPR) repeat protein
MALCFYGWTGDQYTVAEVVKPDKEDKNVSSHEMAAYVRSMDDLHATVGYAADTRVLKLLLSNGFPVIVETWFIPEPGDEMGHYRLLTGYDDAAQQFMTQDAYLGGDRAIAYAELQTMWKVFNRAFIVVCETSRSQDLTALLGDSAAFPAMHRSALAVALAETAEQPDDRYAWFNVATNYVALEQYEAAAQAYDRARNLKLPYRMLWYQFGPFEAYLRVGRYQDVIDLATASLRTAENLEESYYYRALARRALGDSTAARQDLEAALRYNPTYGAAAGALGQ